MGVIRIAASLAIGGLALVASPVFALDGERCERAWNVFTENYDATEDAKLMSREVMVGERIHTGDGSPLSEAEKRYVQAGTAFGLVYSFKARGLTDEEFVESEPAMAEGLVASSIVLACNPPTRPLFLPDGNDLTARINRAILEVHSDRLQLALPSLAEKFK